MKKPMMVENNKDGDGGTFLEKRLSDDVDCADAILDTLKDIKNDGEEIYECVLMAWVKSTTNGSKKGLRYITTKNQIDKVQVFAAFHALCGFIASKTGMSKALRNNPTDEQITSIAQFIAELSYMSVAELSMQGLGIDQTFEEKDAIADKLLKEADKHYDDLRNGDGEIKFLKGVTKKISDANDPVYKKVSEKFTSADYLRKEWLKELENDD